MNGIGNRDAKEILRSFLEIANGNRKRTSLTIPQALIEISNALLSNTLNHMQSRFRPDETFS